MDSYIKNNTSNNLLKKMQSNYDNKLETKKKIYNKILKRIENLMNESATNGKDMCMYVVPEIILGLPIYNLKECLIYIKHILTKQSFNVVIGEPNILFIFWKLKNKIVNNFDNQKKIENYSTNNIVDYMSVNNYANNNNNNNNNITKEKSIKDMKVPQAFFFNH